MNSYDQVEYKSLPFAQSSPKHLKTISKLYGFNAPELETSRVLEIGCASGGNIIPLAYQYPDATFVGFDASQKQIEKGQSILDELGLKNIELQHQTIENYDLNSEKFDYIIAHGVFSWVHHDIQKSLLKLYQHLLNEGGIAYVSYNTYPGWNMVKSIRDLMLFHTSNSSSPTQKIEQARDILKTFSSEIKDGDQAYLSALKKEQQFLSQFDDYYLCHDHLETDNHPIYFKDFHALVENHDMHYLCDANPKNINSQHPSKKIKELLNNTSNRMEREQYLDFVHNTRYRASLLTKSKNFKPSLKTQHLSDLYLSSNLKASQKVTSQTLNNSSEISFKKGALTLNTKNSISKCLLHLMIEHQRESLSYEDLITQASAMCSKPKDQVEQYFHQRFNILELISAGAIQVFNSNHPVYNKVDPQPRAYKVARVMAKISNEVPNVHHQSVKLSRDDLLCLSLCDGHTSQDSIIQSLYEQALKNHTKKSEDKNFKKTLSDYVQQTLNKFADFGLLEKMV